MTNFPSDLDDDTTLPFVNDNITEIGGEAINALRDAVFAIEQNIGIGAAGTTASISERFGVSFFPDGYLKPSVIAGLGLVTLPITQDQIAPWAMIPESKLKLDHRTQDLFNYIRDLSGDVNLAIGWISTTGIKLDPHLMGAIYRHTLDQIDVSNLSANFLNNKFRVLRDNLQSYNLVRDINNELLAHQWADGSPFGSIQDIITNNGSTYPSNYGHTASGIFLNTSRFATIPQTTEDLQLLAEYIDTSSIFLLGTRIQNLYSNGVSKASRSSAFGSQYGTDGYGQGQPIIPLTPAIAYLKDIGSNSSPFDNINTGDDIVEFKPSQAEIDNNTFDAKFALVKVGDIIRVNYGDLEVPFIIKEKKYNQNGGDKKYIVRIAGKNLAYSPNAIARVDKPLFYNNKYGVLAIAAANNNFNGMSSLIVTSPRGGEALGVGFDPNQFNESHYLLYLAIYPTGNAQDGYTILPAIDVTGNLGVTPGLYTLQSAVEATNNAFRRNGYNYRFVAFSYQGEYGIMLADSYHNAAFSILNGIVGDDGFFDEVATDLNFPNNVVDLFPASGTVAPDPLGFGPYGANIASPPFMNAYGSAEASQNPTKLFVPLTKNNFYVNGIERDRLTLDDGQALDGYGDGYWVAQIVNKQIFPGPIPSGRVQTTYRIPLDLSISQLKVGKTLVIQSAGAGALVDFGRFIIQSVTFGCCPANYTDVTVYDAVHGKGFSPTSTLAQDGYVALYFNSDSVSFNRETATDFDELTTFKRHFEVYISPDGTTFTHERGRFLAAGTSIIVNGVTIYSSTEMSKMNIVKISPKLRGYQFGSVNKITMSITSYNTTTGIYTGNLASYDGVTLTRLGPTATGKKGEITRFYDETNIDYIDVVFDINTSISSVTNQIIDFQLFPTLSFDDEVMMIGTCQLDDNNFYISQVRDERQFGNTSEKELSTSAHNYISLPERVLHFNGVVRGFDITNVTSELISISGGLALVNGKFQSINDEVFTIPKVREIYAFTEYTVNWALCVNSIGELAIIPLVDFDTTAAGPPADATKIFAAKNAVSSNTYNIDSTTFSNLLNNRKDLTILYIVRSTVTGSGPSATVALTYKDVRRFINDQDSCGPIVVTNDNAQGNYKDITSALNWIRLNNSFQNTIYLKGSGSNNTYSGAYTATELQVNMLAGGIGASVVFNGAATVNRFRFSDLAVLVTGNGSFTDSAFTRGSLNLNGGSGTFSFTDVSRLTTFGIATNFISDHSRFTDMVNTISISGTGNFNICSFSNAPMSFSGAVTMVSTDLANSNLSCTALDINFGYITNSNLTANTSGSFSNATFVDENINVSSTFTATNCIFENCIINVGTTANITGCRFTNCTFSVISTSTVGTTQFFNSNTSFVGVITATSVTWKDCTVAFGSTGSLTNCLIDPSVVTITNTLTVSGTTITDSTVTISAVRGFTLSDNFLFERNTVTWTGAPVSGYAGTDLVNAGNGMMYASLAGTLNNVKVRENTFSYALQDHFPFFSIQMTAFAALVRNVEVSGNRFTSTTGIDDPRAVIAIVSTLLARASIGVFPQFPALTNVHFDDNICNYNQMIIITGSKDPALGSMNGANPVTTNTTISRNTCGTIGYFPGSAGPFDGNTIDTGVFRDKSNKLIIDSNYCKFIANLEATGKYIAFRATNFPNNNFYEEVASTVGETSITNNTCNWIQVGAGGYTIGQSGVNIIGNTVSPSNPSFLNNFTSSGIQSITPANVGILLRREHNAIGSSSSIIANNNIVQKYTTTASTGVTITAATNASPIVITSSTAHGFLAGQLVNVSGVLGNTAANGTWIVAAPTTFTFQLAGSVGNGAYSSGGIAVASNIYYYVAAMVVFNHARINNNVIAGVINSSVNAMIYLWDINSQIITGNILERRGLSVNAYIYVDGLSAPNPAGAGGLGTAAQRLMVMDNQMDNIDGSGVINRIYIAYGVGRVDLTSGNTGTQPGWYSFHNIAGNQSAGFQFV